MSKEHWKTAWTRGGKLEEIVWLGKDVLAWCSGVHIVFFSIDQKKRSIYWCWSQETGEGARCLSAHSSFLVFAFAERVINPRILVLSYPSMTKVSEFSGGCPTGYVATAFTAQDHLAAVGSYPQFAMTIWNWRTGEKIATVNTFIRDDVGQILRITLVGPCVVAQMGKTCGKLYTWEVDVAGKTAILLDHEIKLPKNQPILWVDWCPTSKDPLLAITDVDGHIFVSNYDGSDVHRIVLSQRCGICTEIDVPAICWFRGGIVLRTTFCQIRFYSRNPRTSLWRKEWHVKSETKPYILLAHHLSSSRFFYYTLEGRFMQIDFPEDGAPRVDKYFDYGGVYRFADFIYPWCHHLVVTCDAKELTVLECYEGTPVSTVDPEVEGEITCQTAHPDFPMVVFGTDQGELTFVSLADPEEPKIVARLRLQRTPLDLIKFSNSGRSVLVAEKRTGDCYLINLQRDKMYTVQCLIKVRRMIADFLIFEGYKKLRILVLYVGAKQFNVGQQFLLFEVSEDQSLITDSIHSLNLPGVYRNLWHVPGNPMLLVGSPYLTRQLRVQRVQDFRHVILEDALATGHQVKLANLFVGRFWITTAALDGLVLVRDKTMRNVIANIMTHHRSDLGTLKAMANRPGDLIISLGYNGSLIATKAVGTDRKDFPHSATSSPKESHHPSKVELGLYERFKRKISSDYSNLDPSIHEQLTRSKYEFPDPEKDPEKTWSDWRKQLELQEEEQKCREQRTAILSDFEVLKGKVKKLLDANEASPEIEKLPVAFFDLDIKGREQKLKAGRDVCENLRLELEHNIYEMQRVTRWIQQTFWEPQTVVGKCLFAMFGTMEVTNYPEAAGQPHANDHLKWAVFCKTTAYRIFESVELEPWKVYTEEELQVELNKKIKLYREEERRIDLLLDDEDEEEDDKDVAVDEVDEMRPIEGTSTHLYFEPSYYYPQVGYYGFSQIMINSRLLMYDSEKLRAYFNQAFDKVYSMKEREMNVIRERIERIRYIDSELRNMFGRQVPYVPSDPEWHWQERPETITKVQDHEVKAKPYISPSQQELLDKQAAEEERIRLLLLADDFRERALMAMMDGVLEVRWEDTIKIDIPKPACMLEKKPENYTAEDILVVKQYEKDVQFLMEERGRYNRMLDAEYGKVMGLLKEGIDRFNGKLKDLFHLKLNIEAATHQLYMRYVRGWLLLHHRRKSLDEEDALKKKISSKSQYEEILQSKLQSIRIVHQEAINKHASLVNREKIMSRRFRSEFASLNKLHTELLERQYSRRPRSNLKNFEAFDFEDLATHVVSKATTTYLLPEYKDYLRVLHNLDVRPTTLPATIDTQHWEHLVKIRRNRIELELRIRGKQTEISEIEGLILMFEQKIEKCRNEAEDLRKSLDELRKRRYVEELNVELQLVLKMGQVEVELESDSNATEKAILISRNEIEVVNGFIRAAGACKLKALNRLLSFQRGTLLKEWKHECKKKRLEDLEEDLRFLESVTVSKEMQRYLKRKARGLPDDKTPRRLNEDIASIRKRLQEIVGEHESRARALQKEIYGVRCKNEQLDRQILRMNVARCEMEQRRDLIGEGKQLQHAERKLKMVMRRSELIRKLQNTYAEIIELQTEHELLRLKRYPTFHFKMLDDENERGEKEDNRRRPC